MVSLADYRCKHEGEDIYVLASGKSVDYFDKSMFQSRVTIGVNQMMDIVPCTYAVRKEMSVVQLDKYLSGMTETTPRLFLSKGACGGENAKNKELMQEPKYKHLVEKGQVVLYNHAINKRSMPSELPTASDSLVVSYSTVTTAIHLATVMGARAIYVVGHDCGLLDGKMNCTGYHTPASLSNWSKKPSEQVAKYSKWLGDIEKQTSQLRSLLKTKYGCHVVSLSPFVGLGMEGHKLTNT